MIVDSSALISISLGEVDAEVFLAKLLEVKATLSAANWLESAIVADRRSPESRYTFDETLQTCDIETVPVSVEQARLAREAYRRFGKGSGSPAQLNYGDCFAYALAIITGDTLLFKGDDFTHTDIRSAL